VRESSYATIAGGSSNTMVGYAFASTISGGQGNLMDLGAGSSFIGGGIENSIGGYSGGCTIVGGNNNRIDSYVAVGSIGGGLGNYVGFAADAATIAGGWANRIGQGAGSTTMAGGNSNEIGDNSTYSVVSGGFFNMVRSNAPYAVIPGGFDNLAAASHSFAAGQRAQALHGGAFVWSDSSGTDQPSPPFGGIPFASTASNQFSVRATGGVRFVTHTNGTTGAELAPGSGTWSSISDRNAKENFSRVNGRAILEKVAQLPVATWNYKSQDKSIRHIGPMAQDFHSAFGVGENDRTITTVDADGVALGAIQGLNEKLEEQIKAKDSQIRSLEQRIEKLERLLNTVTTDLGAR
jgi:endosialidase-like protein